jgi:hypothetical protein
VFLKGGRRLPPHIKWFLSYKFRNLFSGAFDRTPDVSPLPVVVPSPTTAAVRQVAHMLKTAKKPVFIVASQATLFNGRESTADEVCSAVHYRAVACRAAMPRVVNERADCAVPLRWVTRA